MKSHCGKVNWKYLSMLESDAQSNTHVSYRLDLMEFIRRPKSKGIKNSKKEVKLRGREI